MEPTIIIPAYNEARTIAGVIRRVRERYPRVLVVDDGSSDDTARLVEAEGVRVYRHVINRGLGGALGAGIAAALRECAEILVTFDAHGQHEVEEIERLIAPIREEMADLVIGSRMLRPEGMPLFRRIANRIGIRVTWVLFGILFFWQLPHTLAIARLYRDDFARAGVRLLPVVDVKGTRTACHILAGCFGLLAVSLLPAVIGLAGPIYLAGAFLLGAAFVTLGVRQALQPSVAVARRVLFGSLVYLPVVLALLALDKA